MPMPLFYGTTRSLVVGLTPRRRRFVAKFVENHLANGRVDTSRSHYTLNGRKVRHRKVRHAMATACPWWLP